MTFQLSNKLRTSLALCLISLAGLQHPQAESQFLGTGSGSGGRDFQRERMLIAATESASRSYVDTPYNEAREKLTAAGFTLDDTRTMGFFTRYRFKGGLAAAAGSARASWQPYIDLIVKHENEPRATDPTRKLSEIRVGFVLRSDYAVDVLRVAHSVPTMHRVLRNLHCRKFSRKFDEIRDVRISCSLVDGDATDHTYSLLVTPSFGSSGTRRQLEHVGSISFVQQIKVIPQRDNIDGYWNRDLIELAFDRELIKQGSTESTSERRY